MTTIDPRPPAQPSGDAPGRFTAPLAPLAAPDQHPTPPDHRVRATQIIVIATWTALAVGAINVVWLLFTRFVLDRFIWYGREFVWMMPASYLIFFLLGAVPLVAVTFLAPRLLRFRWVVFAFVAAGAWTLAIPFSQISRIASLALAMGFAAQVARIVAARPDAWLRLMRRSSVAIALLVGAAGIAGRVWRSAAEARMMASLPTPPPGAPNVLLIILDTVRAASLGLYGYDRETTPFLARWARDGAVFDRAISTSPWTLPSHASMFTGRYPSEQSGDWEAPLDDAHPTLAEVFRDRGYATGGFVANDDYASWESGLQRGFVHYEDYLVTPRELLLTSTIAQTHWVDQMLASQSLGEAWRRFLRPAFWVRDKHNNARKDGEVVARQFLDWQRSLGGRPYFAFLNFFDAHAPYEPEPPFDTRFVGANRQQDLYDGAIASLDARLGALFRELRRRGALDNTIVVVTSDHGELLGEHDQWGHAHSMYLPVLHVPLIVRAPGRVPAGVRVTEVVSMRDLAATVLDLARAHDDRFPGRSLAASWGDGRSGGTALSQVNRAPNVAPELPTSRGPMQSIIDGGFHYIRNGDGAEELYAYPDDPDESENLIPRLGEEESDEWRARVEALLRDRE